MDIKLQSSKKLFDNGWFIAALIFLAYMSLYFLNITIPLEKNYSNYTSRIWLWSEYVIAFISLIIIVKKWRSIRRSYVFIAFIFAGIDWLSLYTGNRLYNVNETAVVFLAFIAGVLLYRENYGVKVAMLKMPIKSVLYSLGYGILISLPFAIINTLYFALTTGFTKLQDPFISAFSALSPGISEEIIFRFFVIGFCTALLYKKLPDNYLRIAVLFFAIVPHSLNHLPDLFLISPQSGLFLLISTSLLFGLPMAYLQIRKNLETAVGFHWFVDFIRYLFGF